MKEYIFIVFLNLISKIIVPIILGVIISIISHEVIKLLENKNKTKKQK